MGWLQDEIRSAQKKAIAAGKSFSVRLNGTSDLSPEQFHLDGKNILEMFPDVQFYDYTKVFKRIQLAKKYSNYDITFSFSGNNIAESLLALEQEIRVAVVFEEVPAQYWGVPVVDGDLYDMRYQDPGKVVIGLKYKKVRNKIDLSKSKFIVSKENIL
jgi:hypothetical protein